MPPSRIGSSAASAADSDWSQFDPRLTLVSSPCPRYSSGPFGGHSNVAVVVAPPPTGAPIDERTESWQFATLNYAVLEILLNWQRIEKRLTISNCQMINWRTNKKSRKEEKQRRNEDSTKARAGQLILQIIIDTEHNMEGISRTRTRSISSMPSPYWHLPLLNCLMKRGHSWHFMNSTYSQCCSGLSMDIWAVR